MGAWSSDLGELPVAERQALLTGQAVPRACLQKHQPDWSRLGMLHRSLQPSELLSSCSSSALARVSGETQSELRSTVQNTYRMHRDTDQQHCQPPRVTPLLRLS